MTKTRCLIVDDEPLAIEVITSYIKRLDDVEVVSTCSNAISAFEILQKEKIDIIFLDIQMPKLTGIDFIKTLQHPPKIILTTAYRDYALESYELNVIDYLLKPISFERFLIALQKATDTISQVQEAKQNTFDEEAPYIYLKADKKMMKVMLDDILYIESLKDYVRIKSSEKDIISHQKISYLEEKLPDELFIRVHRSFIVPLRKIKSYTSSSIEVPGHEVPIGRLYKEKVLEKLGEANHL